MNIWAQNEAALMDMLISSEGAAIESDIKKALKEQEIDLENPEYWKSQNYREFFTKHIDSENFFFLTYDYYIEKVILPSMGIAKQELGLFDMGTRKKNHGKILQKYLIDEIITTIVVPLKDNPEEPIDDYYDNAYNNVRHKLFDKAKKSGLCRQFEEISNINFDSFGDKYSKYKFLKLLFKLSKTQYGDKTHYGKPVNFYLMFQHPSYENLDKTLISGDDSNGKNIALLKNELTKEIPLTFLLQCNKILRRMIYDWDKVIKYAQDLLFDNSYEELKDFERFIQSLSSKYISSERYHKEAANSSSLFDTVYFWVLEQECLCVRKEMLHMNSHIANHIAENSYIDLANMNGKIVDGLRICDRRKCYENAIAICIDDPHPFQIYYLYESSEFTIQIAFLKLFALHFKQELAEMLIRDDFNMDEAVYLIENSSQNIQRFISWNEELNLVKSESAIYKAIPVSFLMASLFAMRDTFISNEITSYSYYGTKESKTIKLMPNLKKVIGRNTHCQMLWLKKISCIQMFIKHPPDYIMKKLKIEELIYSAMEYLFSIYDLNEFVRTSQQWLAPINDYITDMPPIKTLAKYSFLTE